MRHRLTLLALLFPASVKNGTEQIFITCRELNDRQKSLINSKIYGYLVIIDFKILGRNQGAIFVDQCYT